MLQTFIGMVYVVQLTEQITSFKKFLEVTSSKEGKAVCQEHRRKK